MRFRPFIAASLALAFAQGALANPTGGTVTGGSATISSSGSTVTVNSSTSNTIINWTSFSVGAGETTRFNQPSASSTVLNRVTGPDSSSIAGSLTSNGHVFLINPNGVVIAPGAQIDVGSMLLSTMGLSDSSFLSGNLVFNGSGTVTVVSGSAAFPFSSITTDGNLTFTGTSGPVIATTTGSVSTGVLVTGGKLPSSPAPILRNGTVTLNTGNTLQITQTSTSGTINFGSFNTGGGGTLSSISAGNVGQSSAVLLRSPTGVALSSQVTGVLVATGTSAKAGEVALRFEKREVPF